MLRRLLSRLTGGAAPARPAAAVPTAALPPDHGHPGVEAPQPAASGAGPVFSSRAVRDAALVTGAIETLTRFADGQAGPDEVALKLTALTPDQFSFLQISLDPALLGRAIAKADTARGPKALELRRLLDDLTDSPGHGRSPLSAATAPLAAAAPAGASPVLTAAASPPAASPSAAGLTAGPPGGPSPVLATSGLAALRAIPPRPRAPQPAAAAPAAAPAVATVAAAVPAPKSVARPDVADVPPPAARPGAVAPTLPRMSRADADARRARLLDNLTSSLSSPEASP